MTDASVPRPVSASAGWTLPFTCVVTTVCLSIALQLGDGTFSPAAIGWLAAAIISTLLGVWLARDAINRWSSAGTVAIHITAFVGLAIDLVALHWKPAAQM